MNDIHIQKFGSVALFTEFIANAKLNDAFRNESYLATENDDEEFYGTRTMAEANSLMKNGYPEGMKQLLKGEGRLNVPERPRNKRVVDVVGYAPHIGNAIMGLPKTMIRAKKIQPKTPAIQLFYDMSTNCDTGKSTLARGGSHIMALIKHLENNGIRVRFSMILPTCVGEVPNLRVGVLEVCVKDYRQAINPLLMSYPITHPSFYRRHGFRWKEVSEACNDSRFTDGYGRSLRRYLGGASEARRFLKNPGQNNGRRVLQDDDFYADCETMAGCDSIEEMLKAIDFKLK